MTRGWALAIVLLALGAFAVAGVAIAVVRSDDTVVVELDPGQCFELPDAIVDEIGVVDTVDCDTPHQAEVVAADELNPERDRDYPGGEESLSAAEHACNAALADERALLDEFGIVAVVANEAAWGPLEGRFVCVAIPYGGEPTSGSALDR